MANREWVDQLFESIDNKFTEKFGTYLAEDATFKFANGEIVTGKAAIKEYVAGFFASIAGLEHQIKDVIADGDRIVCRGMVTYTRLDNKQLKVPFANYFDMKGELIKNYQIYVDASELYA